MKVAIPLDIPKEVVDLIVNKAKELGHQPKNKKLLVIETMKMVIKHHLCVYTHEGMKETVAMYFEDNSDEFEDLLNDK
jgi:hypothetical protein